jgi:hypothetical protein
MLLPKVSTWSTQGGEVVRGDKSDTRELGDEWWQNGPWACRGV